MNETINNFDVSVRICERGVSISLSLTKHPHCLGTNKFLTWEEICHAQQATGGSHGKIVAMAIEVAHNELLDKQTAYSEARCQEVMN